MMKTLPKFLLAALLAAALLPGAAQASGVAKLKSFLDNTRSLRAEFVQSVVAKSGRKPQNSAGLMMFQRPGKFRWQVEKPYPQLMVGDGEKFWIYDPELKQVTVKKMGKTLGATPAALLAGEGSASLEKNFTLAEVARRTAWNGPKPPPGAPTPASKKSASALPATTCGPWNCTTASARLPPSSSTGSNATRPWPPASSASPRRPERMWRGSEGL